MSEAHRQETIDDLMHDSNFKKLIGGDSALLVNWKRAVEAEEETRLCLEQMRARLDQFLYQKWEKEGMEAQVTRNPEALKIYEGERVAEKAFSRVRADLSERELKEKSLAGGAVGFLNEGLAVEHAQKALRQFVKSKGGQPNDLARWEISEKRQVLQVKTAKFQDLAYSRMQTEQEKPEPSPLTLTPTDDEWWTSNYCQKEQPESMLLAMPSSFNARDRDAVGWVNLGRIEFTLREAILQDILKELRLLLGEKLMRYRGLQNDHNKSQSTITRAWHGLNSLQDRIYAIRDEYRRQVVALKSLQCTGTEAQKQKTWLDIADGDLSMKTDWEYPGRLGQSKDKMAWFWLDGGIPANVELAQSPIMTECELS
ncbi:hypothetical protein VKT23_014040 [Stygiomarasmius scandens]|uniref:Uncharacterized protein n=1 Tax=Marasmiellus scandens TaxID=2682957 RepID=A0ABR1J1U2_9AGAR